jgi:non-specific riboncleoside hydrolase
MNNIILDVDTGIDDAIAIILALGYEKAKINLISCCYGNCSSESSTQNTLNILNLANRTEIPVVKGEEKPILEEWDNSLCVHGKTGLGDYVFPVNKVGRIVDNAIDVMRDKILNQKGKTTIIALAPLTNVAKLLFAYPKVRKKIKAIVISGGLLDDNKRKPYIGFNISQDAYAVEYIFNCKVKTIICPSDFGHQAFINKEEQKEIAKMNKTGKIFKEIFKSYKDRHMVDGDAATHDACAVACVLEKKLFKFKKMAVSLRKVRAAGKSVIDFDSQLKKNHIKAKVVVKMNVDRFKKSLFNAWRKMP